MIRYFLSADCGYSSRYLTDIFGDDWVQVFECICEDMQEPISYIPQGLLLGMVSLPILWLWDKFFCHNRKPDWMRIGACACCIAYIFLLLNMTFFSREPGSRTEVNMQLFGTWGDTPVARGYVIENVILFLPFGILFPCIMSFLRKAWCCMPIAGLCSIVIEGMQFATQRGYCQLDDVVMNIVGAGIGWLLYRIVLHRRILFHEKKRKQLQMGDCVSRLRE